MPSELMPLRDLAGDSTHGLPVSQCLQLDHWESSVAYGLVAQSTLKLAETRFNPRPGWTKNAASRGQRGLNPQPVP